MALAAQRTRSTGTGSGASSAAGGSYKGCGTGGPCGCWRGITPNMFGPSLPRRATDGRGAGALDSAEFDAGRRA